MRQVGKSSTQVTFAVNVAASKRFGVLTLYAGLQTERSDISFSYVFDVDSQLDDIDEIGTVEPIDVNFTVSHLGKTRGIFGMGLKLGPVLTNARYQCGEYYRGICWIWVCVLVIHS